MTRNDYKIDNSGSNQGLIVGENKGNIEVSIKNAVRIPSLISAVVKSLGEVCSSDDIESTFDSKEFKPDEKIEYNHVIKYKDIIRYFSAYYSICEGYLNAYDDSNMRGKAKIIPTIVKDFMEKNICWLIMKIGRRRKSFLLVLHRLEGKLEQERKKQLSLHMI